MKTYVGKQADGVALVSKIEDGVEKPFPTRTDIRNHSPTGFNWGYSGSGPAQLALAMLADCLGPNPPPDECPFCGCPMEDELCIARDECGYTWNNDSGKWEGVMRLYQQFKVDIIAGLPKDGWTITEEQIKNWLATQPKASK